MIIAEYDAILGQWELEDFYNHLSNYTKDNYRPISVIPIVAKVFERIIYYQLYAYLSENNMIAEQQSGFRSLQSTVTLVTRGS